MSNHNFLITVAKVHLYLCTSEYIRVFINIHIGNKVAPLEDYPNKVLQISKGIPHIRECAVL